MTNTPMKIEVNCETGEQSYIPLTAKEIADLELLSAQIAEQEAQKKAEAEAIAQAKASALAKLLALGLSEDEAKAIAG